MQEVKFPDESSLNKQGLIVLLLIILIFMLYVIRIV